MGTGEGSVGGKGWASRTGDPKWKRTRSESQCGKQAQLCAICTWRLIHPLLYGKVPRAEPEGKTEKEFTVESTAVHSLFTLRNRGGAGGGALRRPFNGHCRWKNKSLTALSSMLATLPGGNDS